MTGAYMTWTYGPAGWIVDLNEYIKDPAKTNPELQLGRRAAGPARLDRVERRAGRRARLGETPSSGASPGATSSTTSPTTRRCSRRSASQPPEEPGGDDRDGGQAHQGSSAARTASACAARAPGRRSIRASCRATPTSASGTSPIDRRQAHGGDEHARESKAFHAQWVKMIQEIGPEGLVDLHLVPGRHRSRRRRLGA